MNHTTTSRFIPYLIWKTTLMTWQAMFSM
jgi:hypothetical protein